MMSFHHNIASQLRGLYVWMKGSFLLIITTVLRGVYVWTRGALLILPQLLETVYV